MDLAEKLGSSDTGGLKRGHSEVSADCPRLSLRFAVVSSWPARGLREREREACLYSPRWGPPFSGCLHIALLPSS